MVFIHRKILPRDEFSTRDFAQVYYFEYHVQDRNDSGTFS